MLPRKPALWPSKNSRKGCRPCWDGSLPRHPASKLRSYLANYTNTADGSEPGAAGRRRCCLVRVIARDKHHGQSRRKWKTEAQRAAQASLVLAVLRDPGGRHRACVPKPVLEQSRRRHLRGCRVRRAAFLVARQVRFGHGLAQLHATAGSGECGQPDRRFAGHGACGSPLAPGGLASGARLRRRATAHRPALLHELGCPALHSRGSAGSRGLRKVPASLWPQVEPGGCDG